VMQPIGVVFEGVVGAEIAEFVAVIDRPVNRDFQLETRGNLISSLIYGKEELTLLVNF
jgi:hypothetical protein